MDKDLFYFLHGFKNKTGSNLKDTMKTTIERAKKGTKEDFIRILANEYIKLYYILKKYN